jgi:HD-like signal output (HDOD) protein
MLNAIGPAAFKKLETLYKSPRLLHMLPDAAMKLIRLIDSDAPNRDVENALAADPALATSVLHATRSAAYGVSADRSMTLSNAIIVLGHQAIKCLALSLVLQALVNKNSKCKEFDAKRLGQHSLFVALASTGIAKELGRPKSDQHQLFAVGAVHEVSVGLLAVVAPEAYRITAMAAERRALSFDIAFFEIFGESIHRLGAAALNQWGLPPIFVTSLQALAGDFVEDASLFTILRLADLLAIQEGYAKETWQVSDVGDWVVAEPIDLSDDAISSIVSAAKGELQSFYRAAA